MIPDKLCLCEICENTALIAAVILRKDTSGYPTNPHDIAVKNSSKTDCIKNTCDEFSPKNLLMWWCTETCSNESNTTGSRIDAESDTNSFSICEFVRKEK